MSDPNISTRSASGTATEVSEEISRSVGSIWQRHAGARPTVSTEIEGDVVTCVIEGSTDIVAVEVAEAVVVAEGDAEPAEAKPVDGKKLLSTGAYRADAIICVARSTRRRVMGFISSRDADAGTSTQRFILERPSPRR
jgi:hypothetical protein